MKIPLTATVGVAALVVLTGCGSGSAGGTSKAAAGEYDVVVMGGLSAQGILADNSATSVNAVKAGVDYANAHGGVNGKKVTVTVIDDAADPTTAVSKLREQIAKKKPDVVLNSGPSTVSNATLPILNQNGILSFNMGPTATSSDASKFPLNFDMAVGATDQLAAYGTYLKKQGYTSAAVLHGNSAYGQTYGKAAQASLTKDGIQVTGNQEYDVTALDMTPQLQALKAGNPNVLIIDAYGAPLGYILQGVAKLGWNVPMIGNTSVSSTSLTGTMPPKGLVGTPEAKNLVMEVTAAAKHNPSATGVNDAIKGMQKYGPIKASMILAVNYDALPLVMYAAGKAKSTDAAAIAKIIADPAEEKNAKTVMFDHYGFTSQVHAPQGVSGQYTFIPPSLLENGQFQ